MAQTVLFQQQWLKCNLIVGRFSLVLTGQLVNNLFPLGVFSLCSPDISHELINMQWGGYGTGERSYYMTVLLSVYGYVKGECTRTRFPALWVGLIKQKQWSTAIHTSISHSAINLQPRCSQYSCLFIGKCWRFQYRSTTVTPFMQVPKEKTNCFVSMDKEKKPLEYSRHCGIFLFFFYRQDPYAYILILSKLPWKSNPPLMSSIKQKKTPDFCWYGLKNWIQYNCFSPTPWALLFGKVCGYKCIVSSLTYFRITEHWLLVKERVTEKYTNNIEFNCEEITWVKKKNWIFFFAVLTYTNVLNMMFYIC